MKCKYCGQEVKPLGIQLVSAYAVLVKQAPQENTASYPTEYGASIAGAKQKRSAVCLSLNTGIGVRLLLRESTCCSKSLYTVII